MLTASEILNTEYMMDTGIWPDTAFHKSRDLKKIEAGLKEKKKAFIGLGCSFVEGQNAFDDEIYDNYSPDYDNLRYSFLKFDIDTRAKLVQRHEGLKLVYRHDDYEVDAEDMQSKNAFTNQICERHLADYHPVNMGSRGNGNRCSISRLLYYPFDWKQCDDIIVNLCLSGIARYDHVYDTYKHEGKFTCDHRTTWPNKWEDKECAENSWKMLENATHHALWSEKEQVNRLLIDVGNLKNWCDAHGAKLVLTTAFEPFSYKKDFMRKVLLSEVHRKEDGTVRQTLEPEQIRTFQQTEHHKQLWKEHEEMVERRLDAFPWDCFVKLGGAEDFSSMALKNEGLENQSMYEVIKTGKETKNRWMLKCGHPGEKAHKQYADFLFDEIVSLGYV